MKAEEISVGRLFQSGEQLLIPLWQRHYSWDRVHWNELWTDLLRARERGLASHFLGSIVLKTLPWSGLPNEARRYWVVDGQQRIATFTILVCAMRDRIAELEDSPEARAARVEEYTSQLLRNLNLKEDYQDRLILQERDRASLAPLVRGVWDGVPETAIERCYRFFRQCLSEFDTQAVEALLSIMLTRLSAVWVTLEDGDNPHRVFQTLNAGGKPLRQADLVRNYFFLLLGAQGDAFYAKQWRQMESSLPERELEDYFVAWTISQGHSGTKGFLFSYFHQDLLEHETATDEIIAYGERLAETGRYFRWIRQPADSSFGSELKQTMTDLAKWSTTPSEGLILLLLRRNAAADLSDADLQKALEIILSFMARRQLAANEPNLHKSIFVSVARRLHASPHLSSKDLVDYLHFSLSVGEDVRRWPTDDDVLRVVHTNPIYSQPRAGWTFSILERINRRLFDHPKHAPPTLDRTKYSVEHVMPQTLTETWVSDLQAWGVQEPSRVHQSLVHVLGNLTITPINSSLSNLPFASKVDKLRDDWLRINSEIADSSTWTEHRIRERSIALARIACATYVAPMTGKELQEAASRFGSLQQQLPDTDRELLEEEGEAE